jgi:hypothetical protein
MLKTEATSIGKRTLLPAIPTTYQEEPIEFTTDDIAKIIEQLVTRGPKYTHMRRGMTPEEGTAFPLRLQSSSFVVIVR